MPNAKRNDVPAKVAKGWLWFWERIEPVCQLAVESLFGEVAAFDRMDRARRRSDRKVPPDEESAPEGTPLAVHLLESLTFVSEIQDAVVEEFRATLRMFLGEFTETGPKFVAHLRHRPPPSGNFFEIVFLANAQGNRTRKRR